MTIFPLASKSDILILMVNVCLQNLKPPFDEAKIVELTFAEDLVQSGNPGTDLIREVVSVYVVD